MFNSIIESLQNGWLIAGIVVALIVGLWAFRSIFFVKEGYNAYHSCSG
jgi:regulator of protease activity HflC (stomatin/prohibitin superfamily)